MLISLHKQAATTLKIRAAVQASTEPAWRVAERYGISLQAVWKWRNRDSVDDRSHTPHRLQSTLTPAQEAVPVALRKSLLLDDLLLVVREFLNPHVSRSGLDRCLRALKLALPLPAHGAFKTYEPSYAHVDVKQAILRYVRLYNGQLPQSVLKGRTPIDALKDWQKQRPDLFRKRPYNHAGCDT